VLSPPHHLLVVSLPLPHSLLLPLLLLLSPHRLFNTVDRLRGQYSLPPKVQL
jgi:hypothetical protein